jgi:hypothetical protein
MKTNLLLILMGAFILNACNSGFKTDLMTGFKTSNNGLSYVDAYLSSDNVKLTSNEFVVGKTIHMYFSGSEGFVLKDGKVNLGASLFVTDSKGNKIEDNPDLFEAYTTAGVSPEDVKSLDLSIPIGEKFKTGEKYTWKSKIWDKNGKGVITGEVEFVVK